MASGPPDRRNGTLALDIFVLDQRLGALLSTAMAGADLRPAEYAVYSTLADRPATPGELSDRLGIPPSTLSGYLTHMTRAGHLHREPNPLDGRSAQLTLTDSGRECVERSRASFHTALHALESHLARDLDEVRSVLAEVGEALTQALDEVRRA